MPDTPNVYVHIPGHGHYECTGDQLDAATVHYLPDLPRGPESVDRLREIVEERTGLDYASVTDVTSFLVMLADFDAAGEANAKAAGMNPEWVRTGRGEPWADSDPESNRILREEEAIERQIGGHKGYPILDYCPTCGRRITDTDDQGTETHNGQRWCREHQPLAPCGCPIALVADEGHQEGCDAGVDLTGHSTLTDPHPDFEFVARRVVAVDALAFIDAVGKQLGRGLADYIDDDDSDAIADVISDAVTDALVTTQLPPQTVSNTKIGA